MSLEKSKDFIVSELYDNPNFKIVPSEDIIEIVKLIKSPKQESFVEGEELPRVEADNPYEALGMDAEAGKFLKEKMDKILTRNENTRLLSDAVRDMYKSLTKQDIVVMCLAFYQAATKDRADEKAHRERLSKIKDMVFNALKDGLGGGSINFELGPDGEIRPID